MSKSASNELEKVQSYFTHRLFRRCHFCKTARVVRLKFLGLHPLAIRCDLPDIIFIHSVQKGKIICPAIAIIRPLHDYSTSRSLMITLEKDAIYPRSKYITNRDAASWNTLPANLIKMSTDYFRLQCRQWLIVWCCISLIRYWMCWLLRGSRRFCYPYPGLCLAKPKIS